MKTEFINRLAVCAIIASGSFIDINARNINEFTLPTPWTEEALAAEIPLSEYPRPQMACGNIWVETTFLIQFQPPPLRSSKPKQKRYVCRIRLNRNCQESPAKGKTACGTNAVSPFRKSGKEKM